MPNVNVQFQGQTLVVPGAYYADNVASTLPANPALVPPLLFIGYGYGGEPKTPYRFTNGQDLLTFLRGGPCADFVQFLASPSTVLNGANYITYINPSESTQSTLTLRDTSGSAAVVLTSTNYGLPSNMLQVETAAGTSNNAIDLTIYDGYSNTGATGVNLGVPFEVAYDGTAVSGVTYSVLASGATNAIFQISSPNAGESASIVLGQGGYSAVSDLVNYLNGTGYFSATVYSDPNLPTTALDHVTSVSLPAPTGGNLNYVGVTAGLGDVLYWINQFGQGFATATLAAGVTANVQKFLAAPVPLTHFSGARSVPPVINDYADALNVALEEPGWVVFIDSNTPGIIALGVQHAVLASTPLEGAWRRFISGSSLGDSVDQVVVQSRSMNAIQATYCYPGIYRTDTTTGQNTLFSGLHCAASVAGMMSGNVVAQPLTNQSLVGNGVEVKLSTSDINTLQQAGVMPIWVPSTTGVPTIVSDLTTWQVDNNPENVFNQQVACRFGLAYSLAQGLQPYVGSIASPYGLTRMKNAAISILNQLIYSPGNNGILNSWDANSLKIIYSGSTQTANVTVNVVFVGQVRFILELTFVQPLTLSA